ncbi:uncharacterized protein LOC144449493 [Glandiceps talaboti]
MAELTSYQEPCNLPSPSDMSDFTVKISGMNFKFNREVLKQQSEYFKVLFESDFFEKHNTDIELKEVPTVNAMKVLTAYINNEGLSVTPCNVNEVIAGADFLQVTEGMSKFISLIYSSIAITTWKQYLDTVVTVDERFQEPLRLVIYEWMREHYGQIWNSPGFKELPKDLQDQIQYGPYKGTETFTLCCMEHQKYTVNTKSVAKKLFTLYRGHNEESKVKTNITVNMWQQTSSSWETLTTVPADIMAKLCTMPAVFSVNDCVFLLKAHADLTGRRNVDTHYYYSLEEYWRRLHLLRYGPGSKDDIATIYLDHIYCYNIRKKVWEVLHPTTKQKSIQFTPSLLYPVQVGNKLHLIIQGKASKPGQHLCFDPQRGEWYTLEPPPLPYTELQRDADKYCFEGSAVVGAVSSATHILALELKWFPGCEMFEVDRCVSYTLFDVTKGKWTDPKTLATNDDGCNMFFMSSEDNQMKIVHARRRAIFDGFDSVIIDPTKGIVTGVNSFPQSESDNSYSREKDVFFNQDTTVAIGGKIWGCAIDPDLCSVWYRDSCKDSNPKVYDPLTNTTLSIRNPPETSISSSDQSTAGKAVQPDSKEKMKRHIRVALKLFCPQN